MSENWEMAQVADELDEAMALELETEERVAALTTEIKTIQAQTKMIVLSAAVEIGRRLTEVKSMLPHGEWGAYIKKELDYSHSTANNFMRVYEEFGQRQESLFGGGAMATLGELSYTKVLRLLTVPEEEREAFLEANDVAGMSTRELEKALKERESEAASERAARLSAEAEAEQANRDAREAKEKLDELERMLKDTRKEVVATKKALKEAKEDPQVPTSVLDRLRAEADATAAKNAEQLLLEVKAATEIELAAAVRRAEEAERKALQADPDIARASVYLAGVQEQFTQLCKCIAQLATAQPEKAAKLTSNVREKLIGSMSAQLARLSIH